MTVHLDWTDVALRLALTALAGGLIGLNRGEHGRPAGLRTTMLVCLAASAAMIQANLLLPTAGRAPDSFIMLDLMRFPLGILSGMGFIGAGAILRRGSLVLGVTTAATLWFTTVMGLCFGGGQLGLGLAMLGIGMAVLWLLKWIESAMLQDRNGRLMMLTESEGPTEEQVRERLVAAGFQILTWGVTYAVHEPARHMRCELRWRARLTETQTPPVVSELASVRGVTKLRWKA